MKIALGKESKPLNLANLSMELGLNGRPWEGLPAGTCIGHVHLRVADLYSAEAFYHDWLGLRVTLRHRVESDGVDEPSALLLSAGGYHHHIGLNTWAGVGIPPPPPDSVGLRYFTIALPGKEELDQLVNHLIASGASLEEKECAIGLRDPSNNGIVLTASDVDMVQL